MARRTAATRTVNGALSHPVAGPPGGAGCCDSALASSIGRFRTHTSWSPIDRQVPRWRSCASFSHEQACPSSFCAQTVHGSGEECPSCANASRSVSTTSTTNAGSVLIRSRRRSLLPSRDRRRPRRRNTAWRSRQRRRPGHLACRHHRHRHHHPSLPCAHGSSR